MQNFRPFALKMKPGEQKNADIVANFWAIFGRFSFFLVPPRGLPLYPITPDDPKNQN